MLTCTLFGRVTCGTDYWAVSTYSIIEQAIEVVKWFINHSYAYGLLQKEQKDIYSKAWALIIPVITRWTAYFCALARMLKIHNALMVTSVKHYNVIMETVSKKAKAQKV